MQDEARVDVSADRVASVAFAPEIYVPHPYVAPATASANPATDPGTNGGARPLHASAWTQAPAPSSRAWYRATVPGTVLTTLVDNGVYPEPLYGENNRPNIIPESLCRTSYWYRTEIEIPAAYGRRRVWLTFDGINYLADVWVNGWKVGEIRGAFARGQFDITSRVTPGQRAAVAVLIHPPPTPADPLEQTQQWGLGLNGGVHSHDGPTFVASQGWDWMPAIRDRNMGIWQKVTLSASGPAVLRDPYVVTDRERVRQHRGRVARGSGRQRHERRGHRRRRGHARDIAFQSASIALEPGGSQDRAGSRRRTCRRSG